MSRAVAAPERSNSIQNPFPQRDCSAPATPSANPESCFDTALPPMSSKQLVTTRRSPGGLESSILSSRVGYHQHSTTINGTPLGHRRTGSTLKTVMRKIFTRKRRSQADELEDTLQDFQFSTVTSGLDRIGAKSPGLSKSASSQQTSALRRHHEELTTLDIVLEKLDSRHPRQRRATLPSLIFSDDESRHALEVVINPASGSRPLSSNANSDPDETQRRELRKFKRRSRSAGALRGMAKDHRMSPIQWRRRSIESDYVASTTYGMASGSDLSCRPPSRTSAASIPKPAELSVFEEEELEVEDDEESIQSIPPNVGELINSMQHDENISLEQRLTTLEVKLIDLEFAIARMQSGRGETPTVGHKTPSPDNAQHKRHEFPNHSTPSGSENSPTAEHVPGGDRPWSSSTIRPSLSEIHRARALQAPSMTSLSDASTISVQQYSALVMLLRREQTARRNLEQQVSCLREDIQRLQRIPYDSLSVGTMYPIRSADSQEFLRMRQDVADSPGSSPIRIEEKFSSRYETSDRNGRQLEESKLPT
ncbi:hypothetical protein AOCH_005998 [Aspergillus ochraceoroseus]|uniref:Uncharacterized protein n=1 Tax=Aspergillus ochraceoroseus TaxID=138278 RepID=A0A0F8VPS4_9EURO|nr:hypothetical protein AOCH_005998 [Aspergillus ochraceoroseus]